MRFTCIAALTALIAGCDSADERQTQVRVYRHAVDEAPTSLDPLQAATVYANYVVLVAYDTLYSYKYLARPYVLKPNLAVDMPEVSADGLRYTIRIKPGVRFVDDPAFAGGTGREVTAQDVVYSLKRHFDPANQSQGAWMWRGRIAGLEEWQAQSDYDAEIPGLVALDRHTLRIDLVRPYPQLVFTLAHGFAAVVPREAVEHYGPEFGIHPVGSGPYRVDRFDTAKAVLSANRGYRAEPVDLRNEGYEETEHGFTGVAAIDGRTPPFLDGLEIHFIPEDAARWLSFTKGDEIHYAEVPNEHVEAVLASKDPPVLKAEIAARYHLHAGLEAGFAHYDFNFDFPDLGHSEDPERAARNRALRCAMARAFDWQERNARFHFGLGAIFPGVIPPLVPEYDPLLDRASVVQDLEGARRLLAEHGWTSENLPHLVYGGSANVGRQMYEQFRGFMEPLGYPPEKLVYKPFQFGDLVRAWKQSELPLVYHSWTLDFPDAENTLQLYYGPNGSPGSNDANYSNPEYDRLYEEASVMQPSAERTVLYRRMNEMLIDDCVVIAGLARTRLLVWHKNVIAFPDREIVGGFFLKYVDLAAR